MLAGRRGESRVPGGVDALAGPAPGVPHSPPCAPISAPATCARPCAGSPSRWTSADRITRIAGDKDDPFSAGHICPKAVGAPGRARRPRPAAPAAAAHGPGFAGGELGRGARRGGGAPARDPERPRPQRGGDLPRQPHGPQPRGRRSSPRCSCRRLRTRSRYSATSVDQLPHMLASYLMFGHQLLLPVPDVDRTQFFLMLGANPLASNGSLMTAPGIERRLKALRARGGRLVVVDPRRTETAAMADQHLAIRPGHRRAPAARAAPRAVRRGPRRSPGRLAAFTDGLEDVRAPGRAASPRKPWPRPPACPPTRSAASPATSRRRPPRSPTAASAPPPRSSAALATWLVNVLNVVTGNLDRPGGAMFTHPAVDVLALADRLDQRGHFDKGRSRVRGLPEFSGEYPVATLADEIETPGDGQVRALVTLAGNPVLSTPNGARLDRALAQPRLHGLDRLLPERDDPARPPHPAPDLRPRALPLRPRVPRARGAQHRALLAAAVPRSPRERTDDWEILLELATRIEAARGERLRCRLQAARSCAPSAPTRLVGLLLRLGPYGTLVPVRRRPHASAT